MPHNDVLVTGIGLVTPIGNSLGELGLAVASGWPAFDAAPNASDGSTVGARVRPDWDRDIDHVDRDRSDRSVQLAIVAADRALRDAGWSKPGQVPQRCGLYVGTAFGPSESIDAACIGRHERGRTPGLTMLRCLPCGAAAAVAIRHGIAGPTQTYNSACASSAMAIGEAMRAIRHGYLDVAIAGGTEAPFSATALAAWDGMKMLVPPGQDPNRAFRPFDADRSGFALGEGAVFFVLESRDHALARGRPGRARLAGYSSCGDGQHWTRASASAQARAMFEAIDDARMPRSRIGGVHAHGVGTEHGDLSEAEAITMVFGSADTAPPVYASKPAHGHLLGASGAIELAVSIVALGRRELPPTRNLVHPDARFRLNHVIGSPASIGATDALISNSFGIGGANVSLVLTSAWS